MCVPTDEAMAVWGGGVKTLHGKHINFKKNQMEL